MGCGTDPSASGGSGGLAFRAIWVPADIERGQGACQVSEGFGTPIPEHVRAARLIIAGPGADDRCCIAFDPHDSRFTERALVLTNLPEGATTVSLSAFVGSAPADGIERVCEVKAPSGVARPCDTNACESASFSGEARVFLRPGTTTDAGTICLLPSPFVLFPDPTCGGEIIEGPRELELTLAESNDIGGAPDPNSIQVDVFQSDGDCGGDTSGPSTSLAQTTPRPCRDAPGCEEPSTNVRCCSPGASLDVHGFRLAYRPPNIPPQFHPGCVAVEIRQPGRLLLEYEFRVLPGTPTSTPTSTSTPTPTSTPTSTSTLTSTATPTRTLTPSPSETPTFDMNPD